MATTQVASNTKISAEERQNRIVPEKVDNVQHEPHVDVSNFCLMQAKIADGRVIVPSG